MYASAYAYAKPLHNLWVYFTPTWVRFKVSRHRLGGYLLDIILRHKGEKHIVGQLHLQITSNLGTNQTYWVTRCCCKDLTRISFKIGYTILSTHLEINLTPSNNAPSWSIQYGTPPYSWTRVLAFTSLGVRSILTFPSSKLHITCGQWINRIMYVTKVRRVVLERT